MNALDLCGAVHQLPRLSKLTKLTEEAVTANGKTVARVTTAHVCSINSTLTEHVRKAIHRTHHTRQMPMKLKAAY